MGKCELKNQAHITDYSKTNFFGRGKEKAKQYFVLMICHLIRIRSKTLGEKTAPVEFFV